MSVIACVFFVIAFFFTGLMLFQAILFFKSCSELQEHEMIPIMRQIHIVNFLAGLGWALFFYFK